MSAFCPEPRAAPALPAARAIRASVARGYPPTLQELIAARDEIRKAQSACTLATCGKTQCSLGPNCLYTQAFAKFVFEQGAAAAGSAAPQPAAAPGPKFPAARARSGCEARGVLPSFEEAKAAFDELSAARGKCSSATCGVSQCPLGPNCVYAQEFALYAHENRDSDQ